MEEIQRQICEQYGSSYEPLSENDGIIFTGESLPQYPIIGCKIQDWDSQGKPVARWFISCSEVTENSVEVFIPTCEIPQKLPKIIPFLALSQGFNFIIDPENEVDVWFEE